MFSVVVLDAPKRTSLFYSRRCVFLLSNYFLVMKNNCTSFLFQPHKQRLALNSAFVFFYSETPIYNNIMSASPDEVVGPSAECALRACIESIKTDKPIKMDYYTDSMTGKCKLIKNQYKEILLHKTEEEMTSPVVSLIQIRSSNDKIDLLCITQNSIYIVDGALAQTK